jgi:hypothetical protein
VSSELAGVLKSPVWGYTLLQACYHEPFILRAVVAIGALNKSIKTSHLASVGPPASREPELQIAKSHRAFAIASYDQAIRGMQQIFPAPDDFPAIRKALLASLLIFCMEIFLGSPNVAWCQVQAGYNLLQQWMARKSLESTGVSSPDSTAIEDDIFLEVTRLDLQHVIKWSVKELPRHSTGRLEGSGTIKVMHTYEIHSSTIPHFFTRPTPRTIFGQEEDTAAIASSHQCLRGLASGLLNVPPSRS